MQEERNYNCTHLLPQHQMEVNVTLWPSYPSRNSSIYSLNWRLGETHRRPCHFGEERKDIDPAGIRTTHRPASSFVTLSDTLAQMKGLSILFKHITTHNFLYICVRFYNNKYLKAETHQNDEL